MDFSFEQTDDNVVAAKIAGHRNAEWSQWLFFHTDSHFDHAKSNNTLERKHLELAAERNAIIVNTGDMLCLMQGPGDRRASKAALKDEFKRDDYFNAVAERAAEFYAPYAKHFACFGVGNHETSVIKHHGVNVTAMIADRIASTTGVEIPVLGYGGDVLFRFNLGGWQKTKYCSYFHGSGGGGYATRGVADVNRRGMITPYADYVITGHSHDQWTMPIAQKTVSESGKSGRRIQWHVRAGSYKDEHGNGKGGWSVERGLPPKPLGGVWMQIKYDHDYGLYEDVTMRAY